MIKVRTKFIIAVLIFLGSVTQIPLNALADIEQRIGCKGGEDEPFEKAYADLLVAQNDCNVNLCARLCPQGSTHLYTGGNYDTFSSPYTWTVTCVCGPR